MVHRQWRKLLQVVLALGGIAAVGIALLHIVLGPASIPGSVPVNATMDSEDRFYATLLLAYGLAVLACVRDVDRRAQRIELLALVFLGGFVARVISAAVVGLPHPFFIVMAALELVLPLVIIWLARRVHPPLVADGQAPSNAATSGGSMTLATLGTWHELVRARNTEGLDPLLADSVVIYSPVVRAPQIGKIIALKYLCAARHVFGNESFRYVRELTGPRDAAMEFDVEIDGIDVNGIDMIVWNDDGRIVEFKVFVRPLQAINLIHQKMAAVLQASC